MITFVYNELKYLPHVVDYYKKNGCGVYIIDNYSNDGTYEWLIENKEGFSFAVTTADSGTTSPNSLRTHIFWISLVLERSASAKRTRIS